MVTHALAQTGSPVEEIRAAITVMAKSRRMWRSFYIAKVSLTQILVPALEFIPSEAREPYHLRFSFGAYAPKVVS